MEKTMIVTGVAGTDSTRTSLPIFPTLRPRTSRVAGSTTGELGLNGFSAVAPAPTFDPTLDVVPARIL